jgi:hypothetical protein
VSAEFLFVTNDVVVRFNSELDGRKCAQCDVVPEDPALCLICGDLIAAGPRPRSESSVS